MMKSVLRLGLFVCFGILVACQSGHCRRVDKTIPPIVTPEDMDKKAKGMGQTTEEKTVLVFKYDGSLQCEQGRKIPLREMAGQLEGIKIISMNNKADGLMHIQVCGSPTGYANVYEIPAGQLEQAKSKGFEVWEFETP
jgi:hypothetical protein